MARSSKFAGIYLKKCSNSSAVLFPSSKSPEEWSSCHDAYDYTWKVDPDGQIIGLSSQNKIKLAHSMGFCPHLRCQLGNLTNSNDGAGHCPRNLCYTKLEEGSPSFGACCFVNGSFHSGNIIGYFEKCQVTAKPIYKHSRVVLDEEHSSESVDSESRFINANRIHPNIIATQCPMSTTLLDVQRMVVQEKISLWIQLTSSQQLSSTSSKHNCHLIPDAWTEQNTPFKVDMISDDIQGLSPSPHFRFTRFNLTSPSLQPSSPPLSQHTRHVWYNNWEDFTVPVSEDHAVINHIASLATETIRRGETIAINCFSGRGRTGTLAAIILGKLQTIRDHDSLVDLIVAMREHRDGLVEIPAQYRFVSEMLDIQPPLTTSTMTIPPSEIITLSSPRDSLSPLNLDQSPPQTFLLMASLCLLLLPLLLMFKRMAI